MTDLSSTIIPKSDQLNADDLIVGPRTFTVERVTDGSAEQPVNIYLAELPRRPYRPSKSMRRVLVECWGKNGDAYAGRRLTLYRDPDVMFGGEAVGGIKISHLSHIDGPKRILLTEKRGKRGVHPVALLTAEQAAPDRVDAAVQAFGRGGITLDQLEGRVGRPRADWTTQDLDELDALFRALRARETTKAEAFGTDDAAAAEGPGDDVPVAGEARAAAASPTSAPLSREADEQDSESPADTSATPWAGAEPTLSTEGGAEPTGDAPPSDPGGWGAADGYGQ